LVQQQQQTNETNSINVYVVTNKLQFLKVIYCT